MGAHGPPDRAPLARSRGERLARPARGTRQARASAARAAGVLVASHHPGAPPGVPDPRSPRRLPPGAVPLLTCAIAPVFVWRSFSGKRSERRAPDPRVGDARRAVLPCGVRAQQGSPQRRLRTCGHLSSSELVRSPPALSSSERTRPARSCRPGSRSTPSSTTGVGVPGRPAGLATRCSPGTTAASKAGWASSAAVHLSYGPGTLSSLGFDWNFLIRLVIDGFIPVELQSLSVEK